MKARELGRQSVVVGDRVALVGDVSGGPDSIARVVRVEPRTSTLRRTADDTDPYERVIVANADQLVIVTALADPEPRPRMIDRCLVAAYDAGLRPLLVLTKSDLASPEQLLSTYRAARRRARRARTRRAAGRPAHPPARPGQRARRALRRRQVDDRQRTGARLHPGHRRGERGHRTRAAHVVVRHGARAAGRRLGHRHPWRAQLRAGARRPAPGHPRLPRPGARDRRVPALVHARRARVRAGRTGSPPGTATRPGWPHCAVCCTAATRTSATSTRTGTTRPTLMATTPTDSDLTRPASELARAGVGPDGAAPHGRRAEVTGARPRRRGWPRRRRRRGRPPR